MRAFEMTLRVHAENLTTVLDVLKDSADLISMKQIDDPTVTPKRRASNGHKRQKNGTSRALIEKLLEPGNAVTMKELMRVFDANGFAKTSAAPAVNEMIRSGKVKKLGDGVYIKS